MRHVCTVLVALAPLLAAAAAAAQESRSPEPKLDAEALKARLAEKAVTFVFSAQEPTRSSLLMGHVWVNFGDVNLETGELARGGTALEVAAETGDDSAFASTTKSLFGG